MTKADRRLIKRIRSDIAFRGCEDFSVDDAERLCKLALEMDAALTERDRTTRYVGSTRRMIETMLGMIVAGDPWKRAVAQYEFENGTAPDLALVQRLVELREAVRVWTKARDAESGEACAALSVRKALKRAGGKA